MNSKTDVVFNIRNHPVLTLKKSIRDNNWWYSEDEKNDHLYEHTPDGFKVAWAYARNWMKIRGYLP